MARNRTPKAKAKATGQDIKHKDRFKARKEPLGLAPIGNAPDWMTEKQASMWGQFRNELPWLNYSHRALLEIASTVRARMVAGDDCGFKVLTLLRQCLGALGATPVDASKISIPDSDDEDPADKYFR